MTNEDFAVLIVLCIIGGIGFGFWQHDIGAGVFGSLFLFAIWRVR